MKVGSQCMFWGHTVVEIWWRLVAAPLLVFPLQSLSRLVQNYCGKHPPCWAALQAREVGSAVLGRVLRAALGLDWVTGRASYQTGPVSRCTKWFNLRIVNCPSWRCMSGIGCLSLFSNVLQRGCVCHVTLKLCRLVREPIHLLKRDLLMFIVDGKTVLVLKQNSWGSGAPSHWVEKLTSKPNNIFEKILVTKWNITLESIKPVPLNLSACKQVHQWQSLTTQSGVHKRLETSLNKLAYEPNCRHHIGTWNHNFYQRRTPFHPSSQYQTKESSVS